MSKSSPCPTCGATHTTTLIEQGIRENALRWRLTLTCSTCEATTQTTHEGLPPIDVRTGLLADHGTYALSTEATLTLTDLRCLQNVTGISIPELVQVKKRTPGVLFSGTEMELLFIRDCLPEGIVTLGPITEPPPTADLQAAIRAPKPIWQRPDSWRANGVHGCGDEDNPKT